VLENTLATVVWQAEQSGSADRIIPALSASLATRRMAPAWIRAGVETVAADILRAVNGGLAPAVNYQHGGIHENGYLPYYRTHP
jgi:hypothetical protein